MRTWFPIGLLILALSLGAASWPLADGGTVEGELLRFQTGSAVIRTEAGSRLVAWEAFASEAQQRIRQRFPEAGPAQAAAAGQAAAGEDSHEAGEVLAQAAMNAGWSAVEDIKAEEAQTAGPRAPRLTGFNPGDVPPDLEARIQGKPDTVRLSDYRGDLVLVHFWEPGNTASQQSALIARALLDKYGERGLAILGVAATTSQAYLNQAEEGAGVTWPMALDPRRARIREWGVPALPLYVLINQNGRIAEPGLLPQQLEPAIRKYLGLD
ncbi:MAG: peroxiredoxin family protein [Opitutales bacterium]